MVEALRETSVIWWHYSGSWLSTWGIRLNSSGLLDWNHAKVLNSVRKYGRPVLNSREQKPPIRKDSACESQEVVSNNFQNSASWTYFCSPATSGSCFPGYKQFLLSRQYWINFYTNLIVSKTWSVIFEILWSLHAETACSSLVGGFWWVEVTLHVADIQPLRGKPGKRSCNVRRCYSMGKCNSQIWKEKNMEKAASIQIRCWGCLDAFGLPASCCSMLHSVWPLW